MIVSIDKLASRYHLLPSEVLDRATTFDLYCMDIGIRYTHVEEQKRKGTYVKPAPKISTEQMAQMMSKVRGNHGKN
jgi:hypothetical protein